MAEARIGILQVTGRIPSIYRLTFLGLQVLQGSQTYLDIMNRLSKTESSGCVDRSITTGCRSLVPLLCQCQVAAIYTYTPPGPFR